MRGAKIALTIAIWLTALGCSPRNVGRRRMQIPFSVLLNKPYRSILTTLAIVESFFRQSEWFTEIYVITMAFPYRRMLCRSLSLI